MLGLNLFFDDPIFLEKISTILERNGHHIKIRKFLVPEQLILRHQKSDNNILITNYNSIESLANEELIKTGYSDIIIIDDLEEELTSIDTINIHFINKEKFLFPLTSFIGGYIEKFYDGMKYLPIDIKKIKVNFSFPNDFYLRIREGKFLKVFNANFNLCEDDIKKINTKYESLYLSTSELEIYTKFINSTDYLGEVAQVETEQNQVKSLETITDIVKQIGIPESVVKQSEKVVASIKDNFKKDKFVYALIQRFDKIEGHLLYKHSYLAGVLAINSMSKFSWMTTPISQNIFLGCILHDIGMKNVDNVYNEHLPKAQISKLPKEVQEDIIGHPTRLLKVLVENPNIHQDVINIIKNHHAIHAQDSYPHNLNPSDISLPFAIFALAHESALVLERVNYDMSKADEVIYMLKKCFTTSSFKKVLPNFIESLEEVFFTE